MENTKQNLDHSFPVYQKLGRRAYMLILIKHTNPAFGFFIIAILTIVISGQKIIPDTQLGMSKIFDFVAFASFIFGIITIIGGLVSSWITYSSRSFAVTEDALKIRQGFFHKTEIAVPYRQIQDIRIERGFFQQIMGVSKIEILTAGDDKDNDKSDEAILPNIDKDTATRLQSDLIRRTNVQKISAQTNH